MLTIPECNQEAGPLGGIGLDFPVFPPFPVTYGAKPPPPPTCHSVRNKA